MTTAAISFRHVGNETILNTKNSVMTHEQTMDCFKELHETEQKLFIHLFSFKPFVNKLLIDLQTFFKASQLKENYSSIKEEHESLILSSEIVSKINWKEFSEKIVLFVSKFVSMDSPRELIKLALKLDSIESIKANNYSVKFNKLNHAKWLKTLQDLHKQSVIITNKIVLANQGLVGLISKRYKNSGTTSMTLFDIHQEGNIGLFKAIGKFDYKRGLRFSTYADSWIRHVITRSLGDTSKTIRVPIHVAGKRKIIRNFSLKFQLLNNREPTIEEIVKGTSCKTETVEFAVDNSLKIQYVYDQLFESDDQSCIDPWGFYEDKSAKNPTDQFDSNQLKKILLKGMKSLSEKEKLILQQRFGFGKNYYSDEEKTLEEVGQGLNLSRERIRQVQRDALLKMRASVSKFYPENLQAR